MAATVMRIQGVPLPNNKATAHALTAIYGIGIKTARDICKAAGVDTNTRLGQIEESDKQAIESEIERLIGAGDLVIEGELRREIAGNIERLKRIKCYRGLRHRNKLPARGQRTKTNARTRKGKKKLVAGKKK